MTTIGPCTLWTGRLDEHGYGLTRDGQYAHVASWERVHGPVPEQKPRLVLRHRCHVRACVRVEHLELGTDKQNAQDRARAGRGRNQHGTQTRVRDRRWG